MATTLALCGCTIERPIFYKLDHQFGVADPQFAQTVGNLLGPPLVPGNSCTTLLNGDQIFPAMLNSIAQAKKTITLETYIYWSGAVGKQFADALSDRANAGVKVHLLVDWFGAGKMDKKLLKEMTDAGVEVHQYHPFHIYSPDTWTQIDHRTHRKVMVVDGTVGFTGGAGIADLWAGNADSREHWRDNHYRVQGPVVAQLQAAFVDNWIETTGVVLQGKDYFPQLTSAGDQWAQVFRSSSQGGSENMQLLMLMSIAAADKNVRIESAYFVPDDLTRKAMLAARRRGVSIDIIVPGQNIDEHLVRHASRALWGDLLKSGIRIYEYQPTMVHCKLLIVDDLWTSIGSSNMDNRSFRLNDEANLNILDAKFADAQTSIFQNDMQHSREITLQLWQNRSTLEKISGAVAALLGWEL